MITRNTASDIAASSRSINSNYHISHSIPWYSEIDTSIELIEYGALLFHHSQNMVHNKTIPVEATRTEKH